jgi:uncharacterized membrane protein YfcA
MHHGTPLRHDKRFMLTAGAIGAVLALAAAGHPPNDQVLTWLGAVLAAFMGQSQWARPAGPRRPPKKTIPNSSKESNQHEAVFAVRRDEVF